MPKIYSPEEIRLLRERIVELKNADYNSMSERETLARRVELSCDEVRLDAINLIIKNNRLYN